MPRPYVADGVERFYEQPNDEGCLLPDLALAILKGQFNCNTSLLVFDKNLLMV
jgi:hypothetical protein